jgi:accessory gene regulator protein AgrB
VRFSADQLQLILELGWGDAPVAVVLVVLMRRRKRRAMVMDALSSLLLVLVELETQLALGGLLALVSIMRRGHGIIK